jgi:hypothetical protein
MLREVWRGFLHSACQNTIQSRKGMFLMGYLMPGWRGLIFSAVTE